MDEGQCRSDGPVRRGVCGEAELQSEGEVELQSEGLAQSPEQNQNRLLEEGEEVEQGPGGGQRAINHTGEEEEEEEACEEGSEVEEEDEEEMDSNSGAFSPEPDGPIQDSQSPSPTASEGPLSPECVPVGAPVCPEFGPSLALCLLEERGDDALLPLTLHQIAEALVLEGDYRRGIDLLQLEKIYHQRVLTNIAALQELWESRWKLIGRDRSCSVSSSDLDAEHLERLRHICRTHRQPSRSSQTNSVIRDSSEVKGCVSKRPCSSEELMEDQSWGDFSEESCSSCLCHQEETRPHISDSPPSPSSSSLQATPPLTVTDSSPVGRGGEEGERLADSHTHTHTHIHTHTHTPAADTADPEGPGPAFLDTGQDPTPELVEDVEEVEEAVEALELEPAGGQQEVPELRVEEELKEEGHSVETPEEELEEEGHSVETLERADTLEDLEDQAKRIQVEEVSPAAGLVSILKRRVSLEGCGSSTPTPKPANKRKVRFRVPDDGLDHDEVGGDSWLLLLLLCLATVVMSVGGTALYCTLGDAHSSVCTDFSHNMDFYVGQVQRGADELRHWLTRGS